MPSSLSMQTATALALSAASTAGPSTSPKQAQQPNQKGGSGGGSGGGPTPSRNRRSAPPPAVTALPPSTTRTDLNGSWLLLKGRGSPSLRSFLEIMNVDALAVEAAEKGESENDTVQDITLTDTSYRVHKLSRVNDLVLELTLNEDKDETLPKHPAAGERTRRSYATSDNPRHVRIESTLVTVSGTADVVDEKTLQEEKGNDGLDLTVMTQVLTVTNRGNGNSHTTTRYFVPYKGKVEKAATAGGSRRDRGLLPDQLAAAGAGGGAGAADGGDMEE